MLGYHISIHRQPFAVPWQDLPGNEPVLAQWVTNLQGLNWIDVLVKEGKVTFLGGIGYPLGYRAPAVVLLSRLSSGPPLHGGGWTIGEDYVLPPGWTSEVEINRAGFAQCSPEEDLTIVAWDLS